MGYPAPYVIIYDGDLQGVMWTYVDDNVNAGTSFFEKVTSKSLKSFDPKPRVYDEFEFLSSKVSTTSSGGFTLSQHRYESILSFFSKKSGYS